MAKRKSYTADQYRTMRSDEWYSVPELTGRWHKPAAEVCRILDQFNITPKRFEFGGWTYWQISALAVDNIEEGQHVLFS